MATLGRWSRLHVCRVLRRRRNRRRTHHVRRHKLLGLRSIFLNCTGDPALDEITIEHNAVLSEAGTEHEVARAAIAELRARMGDWDEVVLQCMRDPDALATVPIAPARWRERMRSPSHFVDLEKVRAGGKDFASGLGKGTRYTHKRSVRGYEKLGPLAIEEAVDAEVGVVTDLEMQVGRFVFYGAA